MTFKRFLPDRKTLQNQKIFRLFGAFIHDADLWHMNRHSVSEAFLWGFLCCFLPIPFQMAPCLLLCIWRRCNIPIAIALVWISNPITMAPMMYFAFEVGAWITGQSVDLSTYDLSWDWLVSRLAEIWMPLIVGCLTCGLTLGVLGFLGVQLYWGIRAKAD